jgi:hypothetical protein
MPIPRVNSIEKGAESIELDQSRRMNEEHLDVYRQAVAQLKALEEEPLLERNLALDSAHCVVQLEG